MDTKTRPTITWGELGIEFHAKVAGIHREDGRTAAEIEAELEKETHASQ